MNTMKDIFEIMDIVGTVAFAISGSMVAIEKKNDIFGVLLLGLTTAVGGGMLRDVFLGYTPPRIFEAKSTLLLAFLTALVVFLLAYFLREKYRKSALIVDRINNVFDAIGLGIFTVTGMQIAMKSGSMDAVLVIFSGCLTGIGGGLIRDLMVNEIPFVLRKYVYAVASITGGLMYWFLLKLQVPNTVSMVISILLIFTIRMLATLLKWNLPKVHE